MIELRQDLKIIAEMIPANSKVLDIGCGNGELLAYLQEVKHVDGRGIEISQEGVSKAVAHGLPVIQGDADEDLRFYPDKAFDYAILSQTIQATEKPAQVLHELTRIAEYGIVSLPNFGYWKNRLHLLFRGRMPVTSHLPYQWHETPNIHFCTIEDFLILCDDMGISRKKHMVIYANGCSGKYSRLTSNWLAEGAILLLRA